MFGAQDGFPPPQQHGYDPDPNRHGPPPAKKAKGNPIITRYPPPPGYQAPRPPQAPYQPPGWPPAPQAFNLNQQPYPGFPPQGQPQPQQYHQNQWQAYAQQQYPGYPPNFQHQRTQSWTAPPALHPQPIAAANPANWQIPPTVDHPPPFEPWPPSDSSGQERSRHSEFFFSPRAGHAGPILDGNGDPPSPKAPGDEDERGLESRFNSECHYLRHPEDVDPALSIGELVWRAPVTTSLALPSTWKESQLEIIAPRKEPARGENSVSEYFFRDKRHESLLSIRQLDEWWKIKDDLIFKEFTQAPKTLLPMSEMLDKYKDRPDPTWLQTSPSPSPTPEDTSSHNDTHKNTIGGLMDVDGNAPNCDELQDVSTEDDDILGNLEQAVRQNASRQGRHSRANSTTSNASTQSAKPRPLMPVRDRAQEGILATLGVTGSPKMVYETPGPAFGPPPPQRQGSASQNHSRQSSVASNSSASRFPPPPPPPPGRPREYARRPSYQDEWNTPGRSYRNDYNSSRRGSNASRPSHQDEWNAHGRSHRNDYYGGRRGSNNSRHESNSSRPGSSGSQRTAPGSDFGGIDEDRTPRPKYHRTDSRKRGYEDYDSAQRDEDATPRQQRYKQPRVDDVYK